MAEDSVDDEKIAATDEETPQYTPTEYERRGAAASSLQSKQAEMNEQRYKSPKEARREEKADDQSIRKRSRESLTHLPSLMAHVYRRHQAYDEHGKDEHGKDLLEEYCMMLFSWHYI